ncbi:MAG: helix-turn-helix transcriptional regulator [Myxococcaceae bacterium]
MSGPGGPTDVRLLMKQVAARLGIDRATLARWCREHRFPPSHWLAERRCWWLTEVVEWEQARTAETRERARTRNLRRAEGSR